MTDSKFGGLQQMFIIPRARINKLNYQELWEGLKYLDGHREFKPYSVAPELEYKTLRESMEALEVLSIQGILRKMLEHRKKTKPWEFE